VKYSVLGGLVLSAVALLSGCLGPSVPEAKDVEGELRQMWAACKMVRPTNIRKTNGIPQGDAYRIQFSYKLEFVSDIEEEVLWASKVPDETPPWKPGMSREEYETLTQEAAVIRKAVLPKRDKFWEENCPGLVGMEFQKIVISLGENTIIGKPARKGEGLDMNAEWVMVKSEKGWISR
jgi:hypothetical protein